MISGATVRCDYCHSKAERVTGREIYHGARPDLFDKVFWRCQPCGAHVGCHPGSDRPIGRLANAELRRAKQAAHAAFDPLWQSGGVRRVKAYAWLARQLGRKEVHIGESDLALCQRIVEICTTKKPGRAYRTA